MTKTFMCFILVTFAISTISAQGIRGTIRDEKTGETIIGATVMLPNTTTGTVTDFDGKYFLKLQPGSYNIQVSFVSYETKTILGVIVKDDETTVLDIQLGGADVELDEIIITAKENKRSENSILVLQKKSAKIMDGISAEQISKLGDDNAAGALKRVTGISVQSNKYVFVRGLGDRYTKTTLNNAEIPSLDPERNSVQMDLFPSNIIDNILVSKTFTPDMPGEATGGLVNIITRDFPDEFNLQFSASLGYNTQASLNNQYISRKKGKYDWMGMDGGFRDVPDAARTWINTMPGRNAEQIIFPYYNADEIAEFTKSFNTDVVPVQKKSFLNQRYKLSFGNKFKLKKQKELGLNMAFSYANEYKYFDDGEIGLWQDEIPSSNKVVKDRKGQQDVIISALINTSFRINSNNKIGLRLMRNQAGSALGRYREGLFNYESPETFIQERSISYLERNFTMGQLYGKHVLPNFGNMIINWLSSYTYMQQNEPDAVFFKNLFEYDTNEELNFRFKTNELPNRVYRNMGEINFDNKIDIELPIRLLSSSDKLKFGGSYLYKSRTSAQEKIELRLDNVAYTGNLELDGNIPDLIDNNIISSTNELGLFYTMDAENNRLNSYTSTASLIGAYAMFDILLTDKLRAIFGARFEGSDMQTANSSAVNYKSGSLIKHDILPSLNLVYSLQESMNLRIAYGRTIARPQFKEFAPQSFYDYKIGMRLNGNPELERALIDNIDLRWEYYFNNGQMLAVSGFYKNFENAIEMRLDPGSENFEITYINSPKAILYGIELELRKNLGFISLLRDFKIGGNFTLVQSSVELTETEKDYRGQETRKMVGQAPYVANAYLGYHNIKANLSANIGFNISGSKMLLITAQATPYIYERPKPDLNFNITKGIGNNFSLQFSVDNILNSEYKAVYNYPEEYGGDHINIKYTEGITYALKLKYLIK